MSDVMLFGVLRMPYEMAMSSELSRRQFYERAQEAANRLEGLDAEKWMPIETAPREIEFRCLLGHSVSVVTGYWDGKGWVNERSRAGLYFPATAWMPLPPPPTDRRTPEVE